MATGNTPEILEVLKVGASGDAAGQTLNLTFEVQAEPDLVRLALEPLGVRVLVQQAAHALIQAPIPAFREMAQVFAVREILEVSLVGQTPTLQYELESGITLQTTIEVGELRRLRDQASQILDHLDSLGTRPLQ